MSLRIGPGLLLMLVLAACGTPVGAADTAVPTAESASRGSGLQQHEAGAVTVNAEWIAGSTSVKIGFDTHSVDVDAFDLMALARLRLDGGGWIAPTDWDAPTGGQHHRTGTLAFGSVDPTMLGAARLVELEIRDAPETHLLRWIR